MSTEYENYDGTSINYDKTRQPVGISFLLETLKQLKSVFGPISLLDAGCGTGTYIKALRDQVDFAQGVDLNKGMLAQAQQKFQNDNRVDFLNENLTSLPFKPASFNAILCTQVLHHLSDEVSADQEYPEVHRVIESFEHLLVTNGALIINTSSRAQLADGFWWASLIPEAVERISMRFPDIEILQTILEKYNFSVKEIFIPYQDVLQHKGYLDAFGPLKASYRDGDSTWSLVSGNELEHALARLNDMHTNNTVSSYLAEREALRADTGQTTFIYAVKQGSEASV